MGSILSNPGGGGMGLMQDPFQGPEPWVCPSLAGCHKPCFGPPNFRRFR